MTGHAACSAITGIAWIADEPVRECLNVAWLEAFPDPATRPARQVMIYAYLTEGQLLSCDALAVVKQ